jgi:lysophospholipase L1-like esterase
MKTRSLPLAAILSALLVARLFAADPSASPSPQSAVPRKSPAKDRDARFEPEVAKLEASPSPSPGGVLMVGSSIFKRWTNAAADLAPLPVTNRAFGGSRTIDQLSFFERIVPTSGAALVVWYCGSNDINGSESPAVVLGRTKEWVSRTRASLPKARIVLVSVIRAPQKREKGYLVAVDEVNRGLRRLAESLPGVVYVDVNPPLETSSGDPRPECYVEDKLHMTPEGYRAMASLLLPAMTREYKNASIKNP